MKSARKGTERYRVTVRRVLAICVIAVLVAAPSFLILRSDIKQRADSQKRWYFECALCKQQTVTDANSVPERPAMPTLPPGVSNAARRMRETRWCPQSSAGDHNWQRLSQTKWFRHQIVRRSGPLFDLGGYGSPEVNLTTTIRYETYGVIAYPGVTVFLAGTRRYKILPIAFEHLISGACGLALIGMISHSLLKIR